MGSPFVRLGGKLLFAWCLIMVNLIPLDKRTGQVLGVSAWNETVNLLEKELKVILEIDLLATKLPEFSIIRMMTTGVTSPLLVSFIEARALSEQQQREFTQGWDLFLMLLCSCQFSMLRHTVQLLNECSENNSRILPPRCRMIKLEEVLKKEVLDLVIKILSVEGARKP